MSSPGVVKRPGSARQMAQAAALRKKQTRSMGRIPTPAVGGMPAEEQNEPVTPMAPKQRVPGGY
jgi:hypothetical protein